MSVSEERLAERGEQLRALEGEYDRARALIASAEYPVMRLKALDRIEAITRGVVTPETASLVLGRILEVLDSAGQPARTVSRYESLKREYKRAAEASS